jgi:hypothetical protein
MENIPYVNIKSSDDLSKIKKSAAKSVLQMSSVLRKYEYGGYWTQVTIWKGMISCARGCFPYKEIVELSVNDFIKLL